LQEPRCRRRFFLRKTPDPAPLARALHVSSCFPTGVFMAANQASQQQSDQNSGKVGSDPQAAKGVGGKGDFGVPESDVVGREYVSRETKANDPGAAPVRIKVGDEARESGVGSNESGPGSGSGGDIDTDVVGVGFEGSGVSSSGPDRTEGADITTQGGSEPFAAPGPKGNPDAPPRREVVKGTTIDRTGGDLSTTGGGLDSGSVSNPQARNDDSFAADIQEDEARGGDNSDSDNQ
jgi:hypothetical protein